MMSLTKPNVKARVMSKRRGVRISITKDGLKKSSCAPIEMKARAMPPRPINTPPIPTYQKPFGDFVARNGPRKMTSPATPWKSGTEIFRAIVIPKIAEMAIARNPNRANHLKGFLYCGKYCSTIPIEIPSGMSEATVNT